MQVVYETVKNDERIVAFHVDPLLGEVKDVRDILQRAVRDKVNDWPSHEFCKKRQHGEEIMALFSAKFTELLELQQPLDEYIEEYTHFLENAKTTCRNMQHRLRKNSEMTISQIV